ncbi:MAG: 30S ribosomal protein S11 [Verrucomicrobia bacterium]|nr:30S ribosomal protein S11 [Verrucomicrobiota bacterium]
MAKQENQKAASTAKKPTAAKARKKTIRNVPSGIAHVKATFNNTIVVITDLTGNVISWASAGKVGFAGSRKSSAFAATVAAQDAAKVAMGVGMREVEVNLSGPGAGRESAVRGLQSSGMMITIIRDKTPVPHNGCRPRKRRRV